MRSVLSAYGLVAALCVGAAAPRLLQDPAKDKLKRDLNDTNLVGAWVYDDLPKGFDQAKTSGKPLLIVFR